MPVILFHLAKNCTDFYSKEILKKLYDFNSQQEGASAPNTSGHSAGDVLDNPQAHTAKDSGSCNVKTKSIHDWGGPTTRRALHAIYTLAFICLLRSDEVLKIRRQDLELVQEDDKTVYMIVTLPFRKTHQGGRTFL